MQRKITVIALILILSIKMFGQYEITVKIKDLPGRKIILAQYYGDKNYIIDTLILNSKGIGVFKGDKSLKEGLYLIVLPSRNYLDFIVEGNQKFTLEFSNASDILQMVGKLSVKGSEPNQIFKEYQLFMFERTKAIMDLKVVVNDKQKSDFARQKAQEQIDKLTKEISQKQQEIIQKYPQSLLAKIVKMFLDIEVPAIGDEINGIRVDSVYQYNFYKDHYFDNVDFSDGRLVLTPVYHARLANFYDKVVAPISDSIIAASRVLFAKIPEDSEFFSYTLQYLFNKYSQSKIMGHDKVVVYLADTYYLRGKTPWITDDFKKKLTERIERMRYNQIGNVAPNLEKAQTPDGYFYPLHSVNGKAILLIFWDPDCGHCKKEIPQILEFYHKYHQKGFDVYAFYTQNNVDEWKKAIQNFQIEDWINVYDPFNFTNFRTLYDVYSTPMLYLLDQNKKIVAKRFSIDSLESLLNEFLTK
ncbi:MAG TPA: thioredoxin-like domain-containing protein [Salinivirgaceae bacterium]|nr:thioredoxin-like domain-containing protein [Salinivirgaceae bacterium]